MRLLLDMKRKQIRPSWGRRVWAHTRRAGGDVGGSADHLCAEHRCYCLYPGQACPVALSFIRRQRWITSIFKLEMGAIQVTGLILNTPEGFGQTPLCSVGTLQVDVDPLALLNGKIEVQQLALQEVALVVVRDKSGQLSPLNLLSPAGLDSKDQTSNQTQNRWLYR